MFPAAISLDASGEGDSRIEFLRHEKKQDTRLNGMILAKVLGYAF